LVVEGYAGSKENAMMVHSADTLLANFAVVAAVSFKD